MLQPMKAFLIIVLAAVLYTVSVSGSAAGPVELVMATDPWEPLFGPDMKNQGVFSEIVKKTFSRVGYEVQIEFVPWKRAMSWAERGSYDGLIGVFFTEERAVSFGYTDPVARVDMVFVTTKDRTVSFSKLADLMPYSIGVVRGYHYTEEFDSADYLKKIVSVDTKTNIKLMLKGRVDLVVGCREVIVFLLERDFPDAVDTVGVISPPLTSSNLYVGISKEKKGYRRIIDNFNYGLEIMKRDGIYQRIIRAHPESGLKVQSPEDE